ncbi:alpha/beta hydrolase NDAI_0G03800 [Naumovozyma dairenensis CBS 421]|uniref:Serine aminopeptidase S33 domain-containing protein n=1 Tax=Naumovozyma dairenensis (strain ATCC 10597 / BCRC 20456 / CBS 421 / NBRC 0211 / NRRL Y-12639) TaxID=1071378 RepID=G0WEE6_NAUDC|nr:hypothetical protein NDAI_0G03800 [Naumovozyma dairenensis CBS 421]CCD26157.2 hypothetical protein NDAI_0G03800 [Naumovozyma dairenensis CBS 421]
MILEGIAITTSASLLLLYLCQNKLLYPSWINKYRNVDALLSQEYDLPYTREMLTTDDNIQIEAYNLKNENGNSISTILILSPNAADIRLSLLIMDVFYNQMNTSVFIYSYRGYGISQGQPTEEGLKKDADCVIEYLKNDPFYKTKKLILYGRSLGGANAIYIASKYHNFVKGIILENTFLTVRKIIPYILPVSKYFSFFCKDIWNSERDIVQIDQDVPFLFLSGLKDKIVPPSQMKRLYDLCPSRYRELFEFNEGGHNDTIIQDGYWEIIEEFLKKYKMIDNEVKIEAMAPHL